MKSKNIINSIVVLLAMFLTCAAVLACGNVKVEAFEYDFDFFELHNLDEREEGYYSVKHEKDGEVILRTARKLHVGDEFIDRHNRHFEITSIEEDTAWASLKREEASIRVPFQEVFARGDKNPVVPVLQSEELRLGGFHSHGAESYVPSDGEEFIEEGGGIIQVGEKFVETLQRNGARVIHRKETHVPHDAGAYHRSRRTVEELNKENPAAMFDVHRDAVPGEEYIEEIDGEEMLQILFVVGRQNQNSALNKEFAESLKQAANEEYPGLVKGILMANGSYNQDMHQRSLLIEVGSHENSREDAEESVELFSEVVVEHVAALEGQQAPGNGNGAVGGIAGTGVSTAVISILWLLLLLVAAAAVFLVISTGSWQELRSRVKHFFGKEFADVKHGWKGPKEDDGDSGNEGDNPPDG